MITLTKSLNSWHSSQFDSNFKHEVSMLEHKELPLQQGLTGSSYVSNETISLVILSKSEDEQNLYIKVIVFYTGIIAGCSCADDPGPLDTQNESCDMLFTIERESAKTTVKLLND